MTLLRGLVSREGPLVSKTGMASSVSKCLKSQPVPGDTPRTGQKTELQLMQICLPLYLYTISWMYGFSSNNIAAVMWYIHKWTPLYLTLQPKIPQRPEEGMPINHNHLPKTSPSLPTHSACQSEDGVGEIPSLKSLLQGGFPKSNAKKLRPSHLSQDQSVGYKDSYLFRCTQQDPRQEKANTLMCACTCTLPWKMH